MSCVNCAIIHELTSGEQRVHINAAHDSILDRVAQLLQQGGFTPLVNEAQVTLTTSHFGALIEHLAADPDLTTLKKNISDSCTKVLAEGIENEAEFNWLNALGIDYTQGYYFGKPTAKPQRSL